MSGHSKWKQIKRQKGVLDVKRGAVFTKLANAIAMAAKLAGGDPEFNYKLRLAIDKAKEVNMPKANIEKAIARGTATEEGAQIQAIVYEGFGPGKVAVIIETLTDNRNRTVSNIKHYFSKYGGALGAPNSVMWMFAKRGVIRFISEKVQSWVREEFEFCSIDAGALDIIDESDGVIVFTHQDDLHRVKDALESHAYNPDSAEIEYVAKKKIELTSQEERHLLEKFLDELEGDGDVSNFYTNT